jgi:hypothetical protein
MAVCGDVGQGMSGEQRTTTQTTGSIVLQGTGKGKIRAGRILPGAPLFQAALILDKIQINSASRQTAGFLGEGL